MISLSLFALLMNMLFQYYINCKKNYMKANEQVEHYADLQLIGELLRNSIRHAGFAPCVGLNHLRVQDTRSLVTGPVKAVEIENNSSQLILKRMDTDYSSAFILNSWQIKINQDIYFSIKKPIFIADCSYGEIHTLSALAVKPGEVLLTLNKPLHFTYKAPVFVGNWVEEAFYLQNNVHPVFMYKTMHAETVSTCVNHFTATFLTPEKNLIRVKIVSKNYPPVILDTKIRAI